MRLRDQYDWIVIGDHPGALLSAALVARLGLSVLVLPTIAVPGGRSRPTFASHSGQYFDPEPNAWMGILPPGEGEEGGLLGLCLNHLGLMPAEAERISVTESGPQVVTPTARFALHAGRAALTEEFAREFGAPVEQEQAWLTARAHAETAIRRFWQGYPDRLTIDLTKPKNGLRPSFQTTTARSFEVLASSLTRSSGGATAKSWFSTSAHVSKLGRESGTSGFPEIAAGLYCGVTGVADEDPRALDFLHAIASNATAGRFRGGATAYRELLLRMASRLGATVLEDADCRRVFIEGGRLVGVQATHHGNMIAASGAAVGCSLEHLHQMVTVGRRSLLKKLKPAPKPAGWVFTLALTVHEEAIPPGLLSRTIWKERAAPALEFEVVSPADYGLADKEHRFIFLRTMLPFRPETLEVSYQRLVAARMFRQLTELVPFVEFHVKRAFPDFRVPPAAGVASDSTAGAPSNSTASMPSEFAEAYGFGSLEEIPENLRSYVGEGAGSRSGIEGLFVVSRESFPRYGSLGGTVAALEGAAWIAHRCGLPGPIMSRPPGGAGGATPGAGTPSESEEPAMSRKTKKSQSPEVRPS